MSNIQLILGDCLEILPTIPDNSVDLVFTSPPYNMNLRIRNGKHCSRQVVKEITTKYENFSDNLPMEELFIFHKKVVNELLRISPIVFYNIQFLTGNKSAFFRLVGEFHDKIKEFIVWDKINSQPSISEKTLNSRFEVILVFDRENAISRRFKKANFTKGTLENLWQVKRERTKYKGHGAVFPEGLASKVIENFTLDGDTVLDPFMGTGTTGYVCKKFSRSFIGIELNETYFNFSKERVFSEPSL